MKKILSYLLFITPMLSFAQFNHKEAEVEFVSLLKKIKEKLPSSLKGYQVSTLIDGNKEATGNLQRNTTLTVDLDQKKLTLSIVDPPKKDGAVRKTGTLTTIVSLIDGKVWIEQKFARDAVGNWKLPVNIVGDTLQAPATEFQYFDMSPAAQEKRKNDLTYNLKQRTQDAGLSETAFTQYNFVFGVDSLNKALYMDREVLNVSNGDKNEAGNDALKKIQIRISVSALPQVDLED